MPKMICKMEGHLGCRIELKASDQSSYSQSHYMDSLPDTPAAFAQVNLLLFLSSIMHFKQQTTRLSKFDKTIYKIYKKWKEMWVLCGKISAFMFYHVVPLSNFCYEHLHFMNKFSPVDLIAFPCLGRRFIPP